MNKRDIESCHSCLSFNGSCCIVERNFSVKVFFVTRWKERKKKTLVQMNKNYSTDLYENCD